MGTVQTAKITGISLALRYDRLSATQLDSIYNSEDYMKSIIHIKDNTFATLGRSGYLQQYELYNEQIKPGPQLRWRDIHELLAKNLLTLTDNV